ncbi:flagellar hook-length control protein FliK [Rhodospirillales bacterium]|nr:flagellar hook-length control protein FliK [Rhodospirillales bacterium]
MEKLTIEQKVQGSTYTPVGQNPQAQAKAVNLGGFAYSFDELLQRVGVRLDHAFSSAEQANLFSTSSDDAISDAPANDRVDRRDTSSDRDDRAYDDNSDDSVRAQSSDQRDSSIDHDRNSHEPANYRAESGDRADSGDQGAHQNDQASGDDRGSENDVDAKSTDSTENDSSDHKSDSDTENNTAEAGNASGDADGTATQQAAAITAAAIYNASKNINGNGEKTSTVDGATAQQALRGNEGALAAAGQSAAKQSGKAAADGKGNNHQAANGSTANAGAAQKAADGANAVKIDPIQSQAQQLSRAIGPETQAAIKVSVNNEQAPVTSRPILTAANTSIFTQDGGATTQNGQQQSGQQQQGTQGQSTQQLEAAQQQAQAAQQANNQASQQGKTASGPTGAGTTPSSTQSTGSGMHNAGVDNLNNIQNANTGQATQQTQQSRDAQAQQQTQTAQRSQLQSSAITEQISVKITKAMQSGTDRISIQLKPAELGRVDVKLEMTGDGRVMTVVTAEKQDTLDLLRRDSSELQRALQDAGLQAGDMEFNLKGEEQQSADGENADGTMSNGRETADTDGNPEDLDAGVVNAWESGIFMNGHLDVRA